MPQKKAGAKLRDIQLAQARESAKNRREELSARGEEIVELRAEIVKLTKMIEDRDMTVENLKNELKEKEEEVKKVKIELDATKNTLRDNARRSEFKEDQLNHVKHKFMELENEKREVELKLQTEKIAFQQAERTLKENLVISNHEKEQDRKSYEARVLGMKKEIKNLVAASPTGGSTLKAFSINMKQQTKDFRCKKVLESIKTSVGDEAFDDFLTELCHHVAKDPKYSFSLILSDIDCFLATVKFKLSDGFLQKFKSFLKSRLGFDVFCARQKIHDLRKQHSGLDDYEITVKSVMRKTGSRNVFVDSAVIKAKNLSVLLSRRLERLHESGQLKFRTNNDKIILGVGGDKGGNSTKIAIVIGNVDKPNNPHGILLIGMYEGNDDYKSLKENMTSVFEQVNNMINITYQEGKTTVTRSLIIIPVGDCKFLSALVGHGGQSCGAPCFLCDLRWASRGEHARYICSSDLSQVGNPYDISNLKEALLNVPHNSIGPPALHTMLGVTQTYVLNWLIGLCNKVDCSEEIPEDLKGQKKVLKNLEEQQDEYESRCHNIKSSLYVLEQLSEILEKSVKLKKHQMSQVQPCGASHCLISSSKKKIFTKPDTFFCSSCNKHVHHLCSFVLDSDDDVSKCLDCSKPKQCSTIQGRLKLLQSMKSQFQGAFHNSNDVLLDIQKEIAIVKKTLTTCDGNLRTKLEEVLIEIGCDLRTWYQELTGNQVRNLLRPEAIKKIIAIFPPDCSDNLEVMEAVMMDLATIMSAANNEEKTDAQIDELETVLRRFERNLELAQPNATITPKLHLLCGHLIPFLREHRSWGHVTEQGLEHLHAVINSLNVRFSAVMNPTKKAELIVKSMSNFNVIFDSGASWFTSS
ncbi:hypothetical protein CRE_06164 [Caenorhabditis remanei]|uniref:Zinc finger PHD-type domain-containing protein n=1 Tax=Caenorhabditis remanei TaxID=31234 RepID=E3NIF9_CAERE|nr:hypothetical protein CRE_06164 [Caenorhabditis remanei]